MVLNEEIVLFVIFLLYGIKKYEVNASPNCNIIHIKYDNFHEPTSAATPAKRGPKARPRDPAIPCIPKPLLSLLRLLDNIVKPAGWYMLEERPRAAHHQTR